MARAFDNDNTLTRVYRNPPGGPGDRVIRVAGRWAGERGTVVRRFRGVRVKWDGGVESTEHVCELRALSAIEERVDA